MAKKRVSSRLARKESQRLMRQSVFFVLLTIVALAALVKWGIPSLVKLATFLGEIQSADQPIEQGDDIAPFPPQIGLAIDATSSAQIDITGYAEAESEVVLYVNEEKVGENTSDDGGEFEFLRVELAEGENVIWSQAIDGAGNKSEMSEEKVVWFDNKAPFIEISSPEFGDGVVSEEKVLEVEGKTEVGARVYVNDRLARLNEEGVFSGQAVLNEGDNEVKVRVVDRAGNESEEVFTIAFYE